jgi:hypothetical protein
MYFWPQKFNMYLIGGVVLIAVLRIRIQIRSRIHLIHVFLGLLDPDPIRIWILLTLSKNSKKTLDFSCFVTSVYRILRNYDVTTS